jgi:hypothetical protein
MTGSGAAGNRPRVRECVASRHNTIYRYSIGSATRAFLREIENSNENPIHGTWPAQSLP